MTLPAETPPAAPPGAAVTARAVALGLFLATLLNLVMCYSDMHLRNTLLTGNHFPTAGMIVLLGLVLGANVAARRWRPQAAFTQGEMLLVWAMVCVAGGIGNTALVRYLPGWVAGPAYYTTPSNDFATYLLANIPDWMVVSRNPDSSAARWYFEGLPRGHAIPWGAWIRPLAAWGIFGMLVSAAMFAFCSLFYRQWADRERLIFPITYLPLEVTAAPAGRKLLNDFLANKVVWIGAAIPIIVYGVNGLRTYFPGIPAIPVRWQPGQLFPDRPWSDFTIEEVRVYFSIVGLTFLLTSEVSFSLWFFFLAYKLSFVYVAWLGAGATGFWGNWWRQIPLFETAGATLVIAGFLFWAARSALGGWWRRALRGGDEPADLLPPRLAVLLLVAGFGGTVWWMLAAGVSWWVAVGIIVFYLAVLLVLTRIVSEAGVLMIESSAWPSDVLTALVPARWLSGPTVATLVMHKGVFWQDWREILLPYLMNGVRVCDALRMNLRRVLAVLALTVVVAFVAACYGRIATAYKYGGVAGDLWANLESETSFLGEAVEYLKNPPEYDWVRLGNSRILPVSAAHVLTGAGVAGFMLIMRATFLWWPLNPFGYLMCGTWAMSLIWFPIFLGWAFKSAVMTFGGAAAYRKWLPLFLGLVLGEAIIATVWVVTSLFTGQPGLYVLPE